MVQFMVPEQQCCWKLMAAGQQGARGGGQAGAAGPLPPLPHPHQGDGRSPPPNCCTHQGGVLCMARAEGSRVHGAHRVAGQQGARGARGCRARGAAGQQGARGAQGSRAQQVLQVPSPHCRIRTRGTADPLPPTAAPAAGGGR
ncbi:unnamed protein product [Closterium sp. Naga37s-1]|nr:unnamed protein product [Closterium sp. Naga37s-1]